MGQVQVRGELGQRWSQDKAVERGLAAGILQVIRSFGK